MPVFSMTGKRALSRAVEDVVEEFAPAAAGEPAAAEPATAGALGEPKSSYVLPSARVLCIPLRNHADQTTTTMLAQLLAAEGFSVDVGSVDSLTNELVDEVAKLGSQIVVISILPPCPPRNSRLLYRRLHRRYPNMRVIIGYWNALPGEHLAQRFDLSEPDKLVTSLAEGIVAVRAAAAGLNPDSVADEGTDENRRAESGSANGCPLTAAKIA